MSTMKITKKNLELTFLWKKKKLDLVESEYLNNKKKYFWLLCKNGEPFSDITVNDDNTICYHCEHLVNWDFINFCFKWDIGKCSQRLQKNLDTSPLENRGSYYSFIL